MGVLSATHPLGPAGPLWSWRRLSFAAGKEGATEGSGDEVTVHSEALSCLLLPALPWGQHTPRGALTHCPSHHGPQHQHSPAKP